MKNISLFLLLAPLCGALIAGLFGPYIGKRGAHCITILGVALSFFASVCLCKWILIDALPVAQLPLYTWINSGDFVFNIGLLLDPLSVIMMLIITFISLLVHIYSVGYMKDDPGYQRFFCYMSLFTFSMLMLVSANNFLQLFFGWEGVGVVSYLLIGFWFTKDSAAAGSLKAFLVNRVGDIGFILGIGLIFAFTGSVDYSLVFSKASLLAETLVYNNAPMTVLTLSCLCLFVGAMGKSAQMPLHVWLPESMEGPTPISALIHAATMVTAGIYMVARLSPLFELSAFALSTVMIVGATTALFLGLVGLVQFDLKRIIAYSTLSQLGYMIAATGSSAFAAGMFHLWTHAFFKALLFLAAGSVIVALHHEQDIRKMGNLRKYLPLTYLVFLIGSLSLSAIPPFSGFYSKDAIIEAVKHSHLPGAGYAYLCLIAGAFVTALYSFRAVFLVFHGKENLVHPEAIHEPVWQIRLPLIVLAIPSIFIGAGLVKVILHQVPGLLGHSIDVAAQYLPPESEIFKGWFFELYHSLHSLALWFSLSGILVAWLCYQTYPKIPSILSRRFSFLYRILLHKYGFDLFYDWLFVRGGRALSTALYHYADRAFIDRFLVQGSARSVTFFAQCLRRLQSGYLYHYAFVMILGLVGLLVMKLFN